MIDWIATIITLISFYLISNKDRKGFPLQMLASVFWIYFGYSVNSSAVIFINILMFVIAVRGWRNWQEVDIK